MTPNTFWKLIGACQVEIPLMQRDYAHGRQDERAPQILRDFLAALKRALETPESGGMDLDFLYGNLSDGKLTLLDGQQRITTLFLLHWYLAGRAGSLTPSNREILSRFTYETRVSSRQFCAALTEKTELPNFDAPASETGIPDPAALSKSIKDAPWFFRSWVQDPTIHAMLGALDAIHLAFANCDADRAWALLTEAERIRFEFIPMKDYTLTDELYIKMNARGRPLTDFENFKAWLEDHASREVLTPQHRKSLDLKWMDLFWKLRGDARDVGPAYLQFFKGMALNAALAKGGTLSEQEITLLNENKYVSTTFYEKHDFFDAVTLGQCCGVLDALSEGGWERIDKRLDGLPLFFGGRSLFGLFISSNVTYEIRLLFYALCLFLLNAAAIASADDAAERTALNRWMRVARNLTLNTTVNAATYPGCLATIRSLAENGGCRNIRERLRDQAPAGRSFSEQMPEERLKAALILQDGDWESILDATEDHPFFQGQIGFLLKFSQDQPGAGCDLDRFTEYAGKARRIFTEEPNPVLDDPEYLLPRALATKGDWAIGVTGGAVYSFAPTPPRRQFWVNGVFRKERNAAWLGQILNGIRLEQEAEDLQAIIDAWKFDPATQRKTDAAWRDCFIRNKHAVRYGQHHWFRWVSPEEIFLLQGKSRNGEHVELRSYTFHKLHLEPQPPDLTPLGRSCYHRRASDVLPPFACLEGREFDTHVLYYRRGNPLEFGFEVRLHAKKGQPFPTTLADHLDDLGVPYEPHDGGRSYHLPIDGEEKDVRGLLRPLSELTACWCSQNGG